MTTRKRATKKSCKIKLTGKQKLFVAEYLIDHNASAAALRAGYKHPDVGRQLLTKTHVREAIAAAEARVAARLEIKAEDVLREAALLAFSDIGHVLDFSRTDPHLRPACDIPEAARRAIASVKVKRYTEGPGEDAREVEVTELKLWSKLDALEKLFKHLGLFKGDSGDKTPTVINTVEVHLAGSPCPLPG